MALSISWDTAEGLPQVMIVDGTAREMHSWQASITSHAVSSGVSLADHKIVSPDKVTFEALITNTPIGPPPASGDPGSFVTASEDPESGGLTFSEPFDRVSDCLRSLRHLRDTPTRCMIATGIYVYEDMLITNINTPRSVADGAESLVVTIEAESLRIGETAQIGSPAPLEPRGAPLTAAGSQEADEETEETVDIEEDTNQSLASQLQENYGNFFSF